MRVLQCVAVYCSLLQYFREMRCLLILSRDWEIGICVRCSVLQCVAVCCSVLQCVDSIKYHSRLGDWYMCALQCIAVCCSVLHCIALCCGPLFLSSTTRDWEIDMFVL